MDLMDLSILSKSRHAIILFDKFRMKINQLFIKNVDEDMIGRVLKCFNLKGLTDRQQFCKLDLSTFGTVDALNEIKDDLINYYIPCKARLYLTDLTEKRAITVLKQVVRLHSYCLRSREKNFKNKKIIFYQMVPIGETNEQNMMQQINRTRLVTFDG